MNRRDFILNAIAAACVFPLSKPVELYELHCELFFYSPDPRYNVPLFVTEEVIE